MLDVVCCVLCSKRRVKSDGNVRAKRWCIWRVQRNMLVHWELTLLCEGMSAGSLLTDVFIVVNKLRSKMASEIVAVVCRVWAVQWCLLPHRFMCSGSLSPWKYGVKCRGGILEEGIGSLLLIFWEVLVGAVGSSLGSRFESRTHEVFHAF